MIYLDVACNDPDNGNFSGRAQGLSIGDAEFMPRNWPRGYAFAELSGAIRLAGRPWRTSFSKHWVGNWCWNRYQLYHAAKTTRWYMVDFVKWLRHKKQFSCDCAPSEFFEWFESDEIKASDADIHTMICALEPTGVRALASGGQA